MFRPLHNWEFHSIGARQAFNDPRRQQHYMSISFGVTLIFVNASGTQYERREDHTNQEPYINVTIRHLVTHRHIIVAFLLWALHTYSLFTLRPHIIFVLLLFVI